MLKGPAPGIPKTNPQLHPAHFQASQPSTGTSLVQKLKNLKTAMQSIIPALSVHDAGPGPPFTTRLRSRTPTR